jgi:hypothetical protein
MGSEEVERGGLRSGKHLANTIVNSPVKMKLERVGLNISSPKGSSEAVETEEVSDDNPPRRRATTKPKLKKLKVIQRRTRVNNWMNTENIVLGLCLIVYTTLALSDSSYPRSLWDQLGSFTGSSTTQSEPPFADHILNSMMTVTKEWTSTIDPDGQAEALPHALRATAAHINNVSHAKPSHDFPSQREYHGKVYKFTSDLGLATGDFRYFDRLRMAAFKDVSLGLDKYYAAMHEVDHAIKRNRRSLRRFVNWTVDHEELQRAHRATLPFIDTMLVKLNTTLLPRAEAVSRTFGTLQRDLENIKYVFGWYAVGLERPNEANRWLPSIVRGNRDQKKYEAKLEWVKNQTESFRTFEPVRAMTASILDQAIAQYKRMDHDLQDLRRQLVGLGALRTFDAKTVGRAVHQSESMMNLFKTAKKEAYARSMQIQEQMKEIDPARIVVEPKQGEADGPRIGSTDGLRDTEDVG